MGREYYFIVTLNTKKCITTPYSYSFVNGVGSERRGWRGGATTGIETIQIIRLCELLIERIFSLATLVDYSLILVGP